MDTSAQCSSCGSPMRVTDEMREAAEKAGTATGGYLCGDCIKKLIVEAAKKNRLITK